MRLSEMKNENKQSAKVEADIRGSVEDQYNELKDASEEELFAKLSQEVLSQKKNGTFDYQGLVLAIEKMKEFLPEQTYKNMLKIVEMIK